MDGIMNKVTVRYDMQVSTDITMAEKDIVFYLLSNDEKIQAIKFIRQQYELSLLNAKRIVESIAEGRITLS